MITIDTLKLVAVFTMVFGACGCTVLLPAHSNSNMRTGEQVTVTLIECNKDNGYGRIADFEAAYGEKFGQTQLSNTCSEFRSPTNIGECHSDEGFQPTAIPLAAAAVGIATDFIKKKLEEEKGLYTAQYTGRASDDKFWTVKPYVVTHDCDKNGKQIERGNDLKSKYIGFEVKREIEDGKLASRLLYGISLSADHKFMRISPIYFNLPFSKAKVLSNQTLTWLFPPTLVMKLFKISNNSIDVVSNVTVESFSVNSKEDFTGPKIIASIKTEVTGYDMDNPSVIKGNKLQDDSSWMVLPPISEELIQTSTKEQGNFRIIATVTERDTSEATKIIENSEEWVAKGSEKLKAVIEQ